MCKENKEPSFLECLIDQLTALIKKRTINLDYFKSSSFNADSEIEIFYKNVFTHLNRNEAYTATMRSEYGVNTHFDTDEEIKIIKDLIGDTGWEKITEELHHLYPDFITYHKDIKNLNVIVKKQQKLCRELSKSITEHDLSKYTDITNSPFSGFMTKYFISEDIIKSMASLPKNYPQEEVDEIAMGIYYRTLENPSINDLSAIISDYADILETTFTDDAIEKYTEGNKHKRTSFKDYTKISVFNLLREHWPNSRNPNKQSALIANLILGLEGIDRITANDISQMNKKDRHKYWKD